MGESLTCYRCHAQYRGFEEIERHGGFNLETHERYRQMAAQNEGTAIGLRSSHMTNAPLAVDFGFRIADCGLKSANPQSEIHNPQSTSMDPDQQRIEEDLRGLLQGDVRCDDVFTQLYASDASIYELRPLGVVRPRTRGRRRRDRSLRGREPSADSRPRRRHRPGRRIARPRAGRRFLAIFPPHRRRRGRPRPRAAGRRARHR